MEEFDVVMLRWKLDAHGQGINISTRDRRGCNNCAWRDHDVELSALLALFARDKNELWFNSRNSSPVDGDSFASYSIREASAFITSSFPASA
jgi:hypothetical protein